MGIVRSDEVVHANETLCFMYQIVCNNSAIQMNIQIVNVKYTVI